MTYCRPSESASSIRSPLRFLDNHKDIVKNFASRTKDVVYATQFRYMRRYFYKYFQCFQLEMGDVMAWEECCLLLRL